MAFPVSMRQQLKLLLAMEQASSAAATAALPSGPGAKKPKPSSSSREARPAPRGPSAASAPSRWIPPAVTQADRESAHELLASLRQGGAAACTLVRSAPRPGAPAAAAPFGGELALGDDAFAIPPEDAADPTWNQDRWIRRSVRRPGADQLARPEVRALLEKLEGNSEELAVLRLKNWLQADSNALVLSRVFALLAKATKIQAVYAQSFDQSMDDGLLGELVCALKANRSIWALNVGENIRVSRAGWEAFASALPDTHVTHLYAGSESTVHGELKVRMRDAIRANRSKHSLHVSPDNVKVIMQIGQMWWNPRNASSVKGLCSELEGHLLEPGLRIAYKTGNVDWRVARVVQRSAELAGPGRVVLCVRERDGTVEWLDLDDSRLSACTQAQRVLARRSELHAWWPASHFAEAGLVAFFNQPEAPDVLEAGRVAITPWPAALEEFAAERDEAWHVAVKMAEFNKPP